jgi:hypothetical protein
MIHGRRRPAALLVSAAIAISLLSWVPPASDTYFQSLPGQSFDITDLPNGRYYIQVEVNPTWLLHEASTDNNVSYRRVRLKGSPGHRTVVVPPYFGIDTASDCPFCY